MGCMSDFSHSDYFCSNDMCNTQNSYHEMFIHNIFPDINIRIRNDLLRKYSITLPMMC